MFSRCCTKFYALALFLLLQFVQVQAIMLKVECCDRFPLQSSTLSTAITNWSVHRHLITPINNFTFNIVYSNSFQYCSLRKTLISKQLCTFTPLMQPLRFDSTQPIQPPSNSPTFLSTMTSLRSDLSSELINLYNKNGPNAIDHWG